HVAIRRGAYAVMDELDACDLRVAEVAVVVVAEDKHIEAALREVLAIVELEALRGHTRAREREQSSARCQSGKLRERSRRNLGKRNHEVLTPTGCPRSAADCWRPLA